MRTRRCWTEVPSCGHSELHLVVLWEKARECEAKILDDIANHVEIVAKVELSWPGDATECYGRFYGAKLREAAGKTLVCGAGPFLVVVVRDAKPRYGWRETSRGSEFVNLRLFAMKSRYRAWTGGGHRVHTTNSQEETRRDIYLLTGRTAEEWSSGVPSAPFDVLPGRGGWASLRDLFVALGETMPYVVLRNSEMLPDSFDPSLHGDIDILVRDADECAGILGARRVFADPNRVHYEVQVAGKGVRFDFRFVGDGYYDARWERSMLANGVVSGGVRRPSPEDAFYALVYHALFQKMAIAPDYRDKARALAAAAGIAGGFFDDWIVPLGEFLSSRGWMVTQPQDKSVYMDDLLPHWREIADAMREFAPLENVRPARLDSRRVNPYLPTLLFDAELDGAPCFVKYSPVEPGAISDEWTFPMRLRRRIPDLCVKPLFWHVLPSGGAFVVLERLEGQTLEERLASGLPISQDESARLSEDMAAIVRGLEAEGIVHRDVRPANLVVTSGGHLKIIDFQFAIDRSRGGERPYFSARHRELLYPLGAEYAVAPGVWNDRHSMVRCLGLLPQCAARDEAVRELSADMDKMTVRARLPKGDRRRLRRELRMMKMRHLRHLLLFRKEGSRFAERFEYLHHVLRNWD